MYTIISDADLPIFVPTATNVSLSPYLEKFVATIFHRLFNLGPWNYAVKLVLIT